MKILNMGKVKENMRKQGTATRIVRELKRECKIGSTNKNMM